MRSSAGGVGPLPCERSLALPAGADLRALLGLADRALPLASCLPSASSFSVQRGPAAVSSTTTPAAASWSRIASAAAKSLRARAAVRCSSATWTSASTAGVEVGRRRSTHCARVEAEHRRHREHGPQRAAHRRRRRTVGQRGVAVAHRLVHDGQRRGTPRSSSIAAANVGRHGAGIAADRRPRRALRDEVLDAPVRRARPRPAPSSENSIVASGSAPRRGSSAPRPDASA